MKELSIEEKAKAYDEIIEKANKMHHENCEACQMCIEELIPELREPEDERIRKEIITYISTADDKELIPYDSWIAWLEKQGNLMGALQEANKKIGELVEENYYLKEQGEQKPVEWSIFDYRTWQYIVSDVLTKYNGIGQYLDDGLCKKIAKYMQEEWSKKLCSVQHPTAWSEEDEQYLLVCKNALAKYQVSDKWDATIISRWLENKLKSFKDRVQPQQEWSEEDEINISELCSLITESYSKEAASGLRQWLKSLRPQNTWKPSEEQMDALEDAIRYGEEDNIGILSLLYNELRKLKEG